jgi:hypothetical protein
VEGRPRWIIVLVSSAVPAVLADFFVVAVSIGAVRIYARRVYQTLRDTSRARGLAELARQFGDGLFGDFLSGRHRHVSVSDDSWASACRRAFSLESVQSLPSYDSGSLLSGWLRYPGSTYQAKRLTCASRSGPRVPSAMRADGIAFVKLDREESIGSLARTM